MPAEFLCNLPKNLTTHLTHKLYAVFPLFSVFQFFVFCIAYRLAPFIAAVFAGAFHCNVAEPAVLFGTVPVFDLCRNGDYCAGFQADGRLALLLIPALSGSADQDLSAALGGMVNVPVVPASRFKGYVCQKNRCLLRFSQGFQKRLPDKILGVCVVGSTDAECISCFKCGFFGVLQ